VQHELIAGRYELEELVGRGGMSSVYRARDRVLERKVALKVLHSQLGDDPEHVERFQREAQSVARLSHPHIVTVMDRGESEGRRYIVFEYVDGANLKEVLERSGPLPVARAVQLAVEIADGLAFAHEQGLVHRDVKPQNVLLTPEGDAKVTDFGIARSLDVERAVTQTGTVLGTSSYLSPEQASGLPTTPATDVYSLGVVLYELLTGELPFSGGSLVEVAMRHVHERPPDLRRKRPDAPLRLAAAVDRALAKDPADRFPTMRAFADELRACLAEPAGAAAETRRPRDAEPTVVIRPRRSPPARRERSRRWLLPLAVLLVAAAAGAIAAVVLLSTDRASGGKQGTGAPDATTVRLSGLTGYDPQGTGGEHDADAPKATDGDEATYWKTEDYATPAFGGLKSGVGLVLDAGADKALSTMTVSTDTPGFTAQVKVGDSSQGPFTPNSAVLTVGPRTTFALRGGRGRYYVLWITGLGSNTFAHVNEVTATAAG